ncbi:hypothetical protein SNE25_29350 [Mucilaginibacter sabulilitoris]|uniref:Transporter n=1 Tax=Mucilaginibacter sabulilitoris TaxID=1173583 RepID=A0ABZ0TQK7_9SPHI|nr:hypothetical protein [Mucilaginibacter sabulilitoris]WPU93430.1 hypothetical protein SNE25_29350 [Mucilaginibacter sabulilitoris]
MKKNILSCLCILFLAGFITPYKAYAGWPIGKYRDIVIPSMFLYHQTDRFDNNGKIVKGQTGTGFTSYSANLYMGYGISRRLDLIASVPYVYVQNKFTNGTVTNSGPGDLYMGLSYNLVNFNYVRFLSIQVSGIAPLYRKFDPAADLGLGNFGAELKLMYCGNLPKAIASKGYFNTEIAYRRYFDIQGPDQLSFGGTVGYPISRHDQLSLELLFFRSFSSNKAFNPNINNSRDYAFFKPSLNYGHQFSRRLSTFIGGYYTPFGKNTGVGYGGSVLAIIKI